MEDRPRASSPPRGDDVISQERFDAYHRFAREHGTNRFVYTVVRCLFLPFFLIWFRLERQGREHARFKGGLIVASNHRSFLDPFVIGALLPWRRSIQFVAKVELFEKRWQAWILSRLGAFPIRRGQSDETAVETARLAVERGGTVVIFPEGTRIRQGSLARPEAWRRQARARVGRSRDAGRGDRHRACAQRLAHPSAEGSPPRR